MADNSNQDEYQRSEVEPPWKRAESVAVWCKWQNVPNDISSQLKMENGFTKTIDDHSYYVKRNEDQSHIVFINPPGNYRYASTRRSMDGLYREFRVYPLEEANKILASSNEFEPVGTDHVKLVDQQFFVVLGKKEKVQ